MEIKWYWLAEQLGLVKNTSQLYNDSSKMSCNEFKMGAVEHEKAYYYCRCTPCRKKYSF